MRIVNIFPKISGVKHPLTAEDHLSLDIKLGAWYNLYSQTDTARERAKNTEMDYEKKEKRRHSIQKIVYVFAHRCYNIFCFLLPRRK